jgi:hypothetical protein
MILDDRRAVLVGGAAFVTCCLCREAVAREGDEPPRNLGMVAFCCLDCSKCDAYRATIRNDDALRAEVAARWKMKPEQIECRGCKSAKALFNCTLKQCAAKRGLPTCAHCPDFQTCKDEQWTRFPTLRETATRMRATLG